MALGFRSPAHLSRGEVCLCPFFCPSSSPPQHSSLGQGDANSYKALCVWDGMCPPTPPPQRHNAPSAPCTLPLPRHLSTAHARLQLVTGSGQPPHAGAPGGFKRVPRTPAQFLVPHFPSPIADLGPSPALAMAAGAPWSSPSPVLAVLLFSVGKWSRPSLGPGTPVVLGDLAMQPKMVSSSRRGTLPSEKIRSLEGGSTGIL